MNVTIDNLSCSNDSPLNVSNVLIKMPGCDAETAICANGSGTFQADFTLNDLEDESILMNVEVQLGGSYYESWFEQEIDFCSSEGSGDDAETKCAYDGTEQINLEFEGSGNQDWLYYSGFAHPVFIRFYDAVNGTIQLGYCRGKLPVTSVSTYTLSNFVVPITFFTLSVTFLVVVPLIKTCIQRKANEREEKLLQCHLNLDGEKKRRNKKRRSRSKKSDSRRREDDDSFSFFN